MCRVREGWCSFLSAILLWCLSWVFQVLVFNPASLLHASEIRDLGCCGGLPGKPSLFSSFSLLLNARLQCHSVPMPHQKPLSCSALCVNCCYCSSYLVYHLVFLLPIHSSVVVNILNADNWQWGWLMFSLLKRNMAFHCNWLRSLPTCYFQKDSNSKFLSE